MPECIAALWYIAVCRAAQGPHNCEMVACSSPHRLPTALSCTQECMGRNNMFRFLEDLFGVEDRDTLVESLQYHERQERTKHWTQRDLAVFEREGGNARVSPDACA